MDTSFLPKKILKHPSFSSEVVQQLGEIWRGFKLSANFDLVIDLRRDLKIIESIEKKYSEGSENMKSPRFDLWVFEKKLLITSMLDVWQKLIGSKLDGRTLKSVNLQRHMARTKVYFEKLGIGVEDACIGAAACAVHLGGTPTAQFFKSNPKMTFRDLYQSKNRDDRKKLYERVVKNCDYYLNNVSKPIREKHLSPITTQPPREVLEALEAFSNRNRQIIQARYPQIPEAKITASTQVPQEWIEVVSEVYRNTLTGFVENEKKYFPEQ